MAENIAGKVSHAVLRRVGGVGHFMMFDELYFKNILRELFSE
jgi:hypothetical protein